MPEDLSLVLFICPWMKKKRIVLESDYLELLRLSIVSCTFREQTPFLFLEENCVGFLPIAVDTVDVSVQILQSVACSFLL